MNAERLHAIVLELRRDLNETNMVKLVKDLHEALERQVNQPQDANYQQQVSTTRQTLVQNLNSAPSNSFPPAWRQSLEELGIDGLLGAELAETIEEIFNRNQITPATARDEVKEIHDLLNGLNSGVDQLISGFEYMGIGAETLQPGESELGLLIPREAVDNELPQLADELNVMQKMFNPFSELTTGTRQSFSIRTISTSDFSVFVDLAPQIAACVAVTIERLVALYKQLLEIRKLRSELSEQGLPDDSLTGVDAHANEHMRNGISEIASDLIQEYDVVEGRRNELETELRMVLNQIANRIDRGYNIDVRGEPPEMDEDAEEGGGPEDSDGGTYFEKIQGASDGLKFVNLSGEPILSLPEPEEDD